MPHRKDQLGDYLACMCADDGRTQYAVLAGRRQNLHETACFAICNCAIKIIKLITGEFISHTAGIRFRLGQADARNFRFGVSDAGQHAIIRLEAFERPGKRVDRGEPGFMAGAMGQLLVTGNVACNVDVRKGSRQPVIDGNPTLLNQPQFLKAETG